MERQEQKQILAEMRTSFEKGDWATTIDAYERVRGSFRSLNGVRLEATCLAARAMVAQKARDKARTTLKSVTRGEYDRSSHYECLARAFLDLRKFDDAALACTKAHTLRLAEAKN